MNKCFELTEEFVARCNEVEVNFSFDIAESFYDGYLHHDRNYRDAHTEVLLSFIDIFTGFKGKIPEPIFSDTINNLMETVNTNCGWE